MLLSLTPPAAHALLSRWDYLENSIHSPRLQRLTVNLVGVFSFTSFEDSLLNHSNYHKKIQGACCRGGKGFPNK